MDEFSSVGWEWRNINNLLENIIVITNVCTVTSVVNVINLYDSS